MSSTSDVVALVPAFNEAANIANVISATREVVTNVLVIDDGSTDNTAELAERAGAKVLRHTQNKGKGEAMRTGLAAVHGLFPTARYLVVIDADMQFRPSEAPDLLAPLRAGRADFVMGRRDFSKVPIRHRMGNWVWRASFNLLFKTKLADTNCGYIAMSLPAARAIGDFHGGYIIETHLLVQATRRGLRIAQVPVSVSYLHKSSVTRGIRMVLGVFLFMVREGLLYRLGR
jgi:glycosyltransferase involved in cell wall biosynthesis